jgi:hypothetical protein
MGKKDGQYKDITVGEGLITALQQAIDYEKGKRDKGSKKIKKDRKMAVR